MRERRSLGARARLSAHRHRPGLRQRGERRPGAARKRRPARRGVHHDQVPPGRGRSRGCRRAKPRTARPGPGRPLHRPLAAGWPDLGVAGDGGTHELGYARSIGVSNFNVGELEQLPPTATFGPPSTRCSSARSSTARRCSRPARRTRSRSRPTARSGTAATSTDEAVAESRSVSGGRPPRCCSAGACSGSVVIPKSSPRTDRGERSALRLRARRGAIATLDGLDRTGGTGSGRERKWWR